MVNSKQHWKNSLGYNYGSGARNYAIASGTINVAGTISGNVFDIPPYYSSLSGVTFSNNLFYDGYQAGLPDGLAFQTILLFGRLTTKP